MIAIVHIVDNEPTGWVIAPDFDSAVRQAYAVGALAVYDEIKNMGPPGLGRHPLSNGYWLLVV